MVRIKVGIVGAGAIAVSHAKAIAMIPDHAELVGATDVLPQRLEQFCKAFSVRKAYPTAAELIANPEINLVAVATPPSAHEDAVVAALEAEKYVLCEKPIAHSLASADRIAAVAARHSGRLSISHQLRYEPAYRRMLWLIQNGWIGEVEQAVVERHGYIWQSTYAEGGGWWGAWGMAGGGALITQMIHELDIMLEAMGEPRSVTAAIDTRYTSIESEDWVEARVRFDGDRTALCSGSVNSGQSSGRLLVKGSLGSVGPNTLMLNDPSRQEDALVAVNAALPETRAASRTVAARAVRKLARKLGHSPKPDPTPHALLYREIARAVESRTALPIPATEALKSLHLCAGVYEAGITGKEIGLPLGSDATVYNGVSKASYAARALAPQPVCKPVPALPKCPVARVGLIGLDTTHAPTFTELLHNPYSSDHIPGAKVVAAFPGGSLDMEISVSRVAGFTAELRDKYGVAIMNSPEAVADAVDVVFIISADGRAHPGLFRSVAGRGKPVFIDKPFAVSNADAERIFALAKETGTKIFASSAFRYADPLVAKLNEIHVGGETIESCRIRYWRQIQPTQGRYFWYGIHGAEMLMAVMQNAAKSVAVHSKGNQDIIDVEHCDGRRSVMVGDQDDGTFHVEIGTNKRVIEIPIDGPVSPRLLAAALDVLTPGGYPRLWRASTSGSIGGRPSKSVDPDLTETRDIIALLDGAQRSHASGVRIEL